MDELYLLVPMGCAALGIVMSLLLLALLRRQKDRPKEYIAGCLLGVSVFLMYLSAAISIRSICSGVAPGDWMFSLNQKIFFTLATVIPPIVLLTWKWSSIFEGSPPISNTLFRMAMATSLTVVALVWFGPTWLLPLRRLEQIVVVNALIILCSGYSGVLKQELSRHLRLCMLVTRAFFLIGLAAALLIPRSIRFSSMSFAILLVLQQAFILTGIAGAFIFTASFRFADVFVKWSVRLTGLGVVATLGATGLAYLPASISRFNAIMLNAACLVVLVGLAVLIAPMMDWWSEQWLLQQADLKGELVRIGTEIQRFDSDAALITFIESRLLECLQVTVVRTTSGEGFSEAVAKELSTFGEIVEGSASSLREKNMGDDELLVPVVVDGELRNVISIRTGHGRRTLLSGEVQFLRAVA